MSAEAVQAAVSERFPQAATAADAGSAAEPAANEFVIFSKPELGRLSDEDTAKVWDLFATSFASHAVTVHRVKILTGPELERLGAMQEHYGVINQISRLGRPALTEAAEEALQEQYAESIEDALVLGGHQFLERYPDFSPFALAMLFSNAQVSRLGPGTYAGAVRIDADQVIILNGFHPRQLGFFTAEDTVCAFLHGSSDTEWEVLRSDLIGATDPSKAASGSIRGTLRADPASFGLASVNSNFNGVHMSAGPLEGLGELNRFFGEVGDLTGWSFAQALRAAGASAYDVSRLVDNPVVAADGVRGTAFDVTEGMNADAAAQLLARAEIS
jgi:hypothetical protein